MAASYLIDSNVLIDYIGGNFNKEIEQRLDGILDEGFSYSIISRLEVLGFQAPMEVLQQTLLTRNIDDFKNIPHLVFENPWDWN